MQPRLSATTGATAREGFLSFPVPPPAGRWLDLYRRYAFAALGPDKAERLLREVYQDANGPGGAPRA